jgi:Zierdtviridae DNA helicase
VSALTVERAGGSVRLTGSLDRHTQQVCESVTGGRFNATGPSYDWPLTLSACRELRRVFGSRLTIGPVLRQWARDEIERAEALGSLAGQSDAELHHVSERIDAAMSSRSYQRVAAAFVAKAGSCLIADQPGLGKTIELLAGVQEANPDAETRWHLVFAPVIAVSAVWPGEIEHWCGAQNAVAFPIRGTAAERHERLDEALSAELHARDVYVIANLEMARIAPELNRKGKPEFHVRNAHYPELFEREWDTIVVDESHRALIKSGKPTQVRSGLSKLAARQRIALSGTPMRGKPEQLWGTLNWLRPDVYTSYWKWVAQYWEIFATKFSGYNLGEFQIGGEDRLADDLKPIMLRRTKKEVLPELPDKLYAGTYLIPGDNESPHGVWLELTEPQRKRYAKFVAEGTVKLPGGWVIANGVLAERTRQLQLAASMGDMDGEQYVPAMPSPKFEWLVEFLDECGLVDREQRKVSYSKAQRPAVPDDDRRVIVASYSTALLNLYAAELAKLDVPVHLLTGETRERDRAAMQIDFQSEHPCKRVFLLNSKAGGVALTLDMADDLVMLDESTIPDEDEQVEDRAHRTSRMHQLTIHKLRMLETIEEEVAWIAASRADVQRYIMDGARGIEYARNVYLAQSQESTDEGVE